MKKIILLAILFLLSTYALASSEKNIELSQINIHINKSIEEEKYQDKLIQKGSVKVKRRLLKSISSKNYFIALNLENTRVDLESQLIQLIIKRELKKYSRRLNYILTFNNNTKKYEIQGANERINMLSPIAELNTQYSFVIKLRKIPKLSCFSCILKRVSYEHYFEVYLGKNHHYGISNHASHVLAAGDVSFNDGKIIYISNQSGAYHHERPSKETIKIEEEIIREAFSIPQNDFKRIYSNYRENI